MKIFPARVELAFTAPEAAALSIRPREHKHINYTQKLMREKDFRIYAISCEVSYLW